ncbi:hypothetical protein [Rhizobium aegyptiacum]|uniref:hypothetical protein n=1 Tax=Rhizobium aegyptiacum TaxID=1764550 RepID=UPI000AF04525|nr:hypothetical protein [Rhizobium aegyptiacum]
MAREKTTISDFAVAPRRPKVSQDRPAQEVGPTEEQSSSSLAAATPAETEEIAAARIAPATETERRERVTKRALEQENSRNRLRDLKRARERESKHFVNVPLDYDTKKRLERAAYENDLKMTVIMKAAIDQYLRDNGY